MKTKIKPDFETMHSNFMDLAGDVQARYHQNVLGYLELLFTLVEDAETDAARLLIPQIKQRLVAFPDMIVDMFSESCSCRDIENAIAWDLDEGDDLVPFGDDDCIDGEEEEDEGEEEEAVEPAVEPTKEVGAGEPT